MTTPCEHLAPLLTDLVARGATVTFAGQAWSSNCRNWLYVDRVLDLASLRRRISLDPAVVDHVHRGTHDGSEQGFECTVHRDAIMGRHPADAGGSPVIG